MIEYTVKAWPSGTKHWYLNGRRHREDGPAVEWADGTKEWWLSGNLHREDGPALIHADGTEEWWLNGEPVTEAEVIGSGCNGKLVEIDGRKYRLVEER